MRFTFTSFAEQDIDDIAAYLNGIPEAPALKIGKQIQDAIKSLTLLPRLGRVDPFLSEIARRPVFRYNIGKYACFYLIADPNIVILGVLQGSRDTDSLMNQRLA